MSKLSPFAIDLIETQRTALANFSKIIGLYDDRVERWHREDVAALIETIKLCEFSKSILIKSGDSHLTLAHFGNFIPADDSEYDKIVGDIQSKIIEEIARLDARLAGKK